ncbi:hypothetical protein F4809DRAFT_638501 [Biscogniauxia mediterranea]|nr:hypothetical protein F4809DRAFT_638501 [Biscogniauxia mediterranea]
MVIDKITNGSHPQNPPVHDCPAPLKIVIVGAGMGGISAAIGLRRNGHHVEVCFQLFSHTFQDFLWQKPLVSSTSNLGLPAETGAAIHLAPNANGLLRCWGIFAETFGANGNDWSNTITTRDDKLKEFALAKDGQRPPPVLHTASKVINVQPEAAMGTLEDGIGWQSAPMEFQNKYRLFSSKKAAFRFLVPKKAADEDLVTTPLVVANNTLSMWYSEERGVVIYPCNYIISLNFVCIHPDTESHAV